MTMNRWKIASRAEKEFWSRRKTDISDRMFWYKYFENFGIDFYFFEWKKVLDVGCGPSRAISLIERAALAIGVGSIIMGRAF